MWSPYGKFSYNEYKNYKIKLNSAIQSYGTYQYLNSYNIQIKSFTIPVVLSDLLAEVKEELENQFIMREI